MKVSPLGVRRSAMRTFLLLSSVIVSLMTTVCSMRSRRTVRKRTGVSVLAVTVRGSVDVVKVTVSFWSVGSQDARSTRDHSHRLSPSGLTAELDGVGEACSVLPSVMRMRCERVAMRKRVVAVIWLVE